MSASDAPSSNDGDRSAIADDHLATTRMPSSAVAREVAATRAAAREAAAHGAVSREAAAHGAIGPLPPPSLPPAPSVPPRVEVPRHPPVHSWWRALLASTLPPGAVATGPTPQQLRGRVAIACAGVGVAALVLALVVGLRAAPSEFLMPSAVAASIVVSRALLALGLLGTGVALLRAAERLYFT